MTRPRMDMVNEMGAAKPFNVRMEPELRAAMERYAAADGARNVSTWAREALAGVVALGGLEELRRAIDGEELTIEAHPKRALALQSTPSQNARVIGDCQHPKTALHRLPFSTVCRLCGATVSGPRPS